MRGIGGALRPDKAPLVALRVLSVAAAPRRSSLFLSVDRLRSLVFRRAAAPAAAAAANVGSRKRKPADAGQRQAKRGAASADKKVDSFFFFFVLFSFNSFFSRLMFRDKSANQVLLNLDERALVPVYWYGSKTIETL